ncbi:S24 family peptidase [Serratia fonticola]
MDFSERFRLALSESNYTQGSLAKAVGMAQSSIHRLLSNAEGSRKVVDLARVLGVNADWLASGVGPMRNADNLDTLLSQRNPKSELAPSRLKVGVWEDMDDPDMNEYVEIPLIDVRFSAGPGACEIIDDDSFSLIFRRYSLHKMGVPPAAARLVRISGDSMYPALVDGDVVGINTADIDIRDGKTYAICHDDMLRVKTLVSRPGEIIIRSTNKDGYPDEVLPKEMFHDAVKIIGRVFWSSHAW